MRKSLIFIYGEATDRNWFSKLEAIEDIEKGDVRLREPTILLKTGSAKTTWIQ